MLLARRGMILPQRGIMSQREELRRHILVNQRCNPAGSIQYNLAWLARDFGLQEDQVLQIISDMVKDGLIAVSNNNGYYVIRLPG